jgi:hypothetical protein
MAAPTIHTYHCLCNTLLLATTHPLASLPRRAPPSLDSAIILPLPPAPKRTASSSPDEQAQRDDDDDDDDEEDDTPSNANPTDPTATASASSRAKTPEMPELGYTLLLSTAPDRRPTIIRRSDGFEKRYLLRCGRCRLVVGYELDEEHFAAMDSGAGGAMDVDQGQGAKFKAESTKVIYLLPGGIMGTEAMAAGKKINEQDVLLRGDNRAAVAAWES